MYMVAVQDLCKVYNPGSQTEVLALKNVNLQVEEGEFLAIAGPSGSGKTTLLHLLGGLEKPSKGRILVKGKGLEELNEDELADYRRMEVGFVFQKYNLIPILTARENIILPATIGGDAVVPEYLDSIIRMLNLKDRLEHIPGELSGGQQQRVSIARALIMKPNLILADEPTGNLDQKASHEIVDYLQMLTREFGLTVIMITHSMELAERADRIVHIVDGVLR